MRLQLQKFNIVVEVQKEGHVQATYSHVMEKKRKRQGESGKSIRQMVKEKPKVKPHNDFTILVFIINQTYKYFSCRPTT